jgi:hypothetical protein
VGCLTFTEGDRRLGKNRVEQKAKINVIVIAEVVIRESLGKLSGE